MAYYSSSSAVFLDGMPTLRTGLVGLDPTPENLGDSGRMLYQGDVRAIGGSGSVITNEDVAAEASIKVEDRLQGLLAVLSKLQEEVGKLQLECTAARESNKSLPRIIPIDSGRPNGGFDKQLISVRTAVEAVPLDPHSEAELDDCLDEWEKRCRARGADLSVLPNLVEQLGGVAVALAAKTVPTVKRRVWADYRDELARQLFPYSSYVKELEVQLERCEVKATFGEALTDLLRTEERYKMVARRRLAYNSFPAERMKDLLVRKIPVDLARVAIAHERYDSMTFKEFINRCHMLDAADAQLPHRFPSEAKIPPLCPVGLGREGTFSNSGNAVKGERITRSNGHVLQASRNYPPRQPPDLSAYACPNCKEYGHYAKDCSAPRPKCRICGKRGHRPEFCFKTPPDKRFGRNRVASVRLTRNGLYMGIDDAATSRAVYESIRKMIDEKESANEKASMKAKMKRAEKKAEKKAEEERKEPEIIEVEEEEDENMMQTENVTPSELIDALAGGFKPDVQTCDLPQVQGPHYVTMSFFSYSWPALLDSGAVVSLFPSHAWNVISDAHKSRIESCLPDKSNPLIGLGGNFSVSLIVDLPIKIGHKKLLQRFFVTEAANAPLLGMDALHALGCAVDYSKGTLTMDGHTHFLTSRVLLQKPRLCRSVSLQIQPKFQFGQGSTEEEQQVITQLLLQYPKAWNNTTYGTCSVAEHQIEVLVDQPIRQRVRRLSLAKAEEVKRMVTELISNGAVTPSISPWAAPIVLVPKANGTTRMCVDYRSLNKVTKKDAYPLPLITTLLDKLGGAKFFSTLDMRAGYYQIPVVSQDQEKTAFVTPHGLFEFKVMPFGLTNAPATFQRAVDSLFADSPHQAYRGTYLDDIVVCSRTLEDHVEVLKDTLERMQRGGMILNLEKSTFLARRARYLGHWVEDGTIAPDSKQVQALDDLQPPVDVRGVRRLLGLVGYFRKFIPNFSLRVLPLTRLLQKKVLFHWTSECQQAWEDLKRALAQDSLRLLLPQPDRLFTLDTDASDRHIAGVLLQEDMKGNLRPLSYVSRTLTETEQKWSIREKEAYAIVWGVLYFSPYLQHAPHFVVRTDHESLKWLWRTTNRRVMRWALALQEFNFSVCYQKGTQHAHVDVFTRDQVEDENEEILDDRITLPVQENNPHEITVLALEYFPKIEQVVQEQVREEQAGKLDKLPLLKDTAGCWVTRRGQVYIPEAYRDKVMYYMHMGTFGAHGGVSRTYGRAKQVCWWPHMKGCLQAYIRRCIACQRRRPRPQEILSGRLLSSEFGQVVALDVIGPMTIGDRKYSILTMIDHFTRYAHAGVLSELTGENIWQIFLHQWVGYFGPPRYLVTDNASVFIGHAFSIRCEDFGIQRMTSFPYHPQGNGMIEAFHLFLKRALWMLLRHATTSVTEALTLALLNYRSTPHVETGETPFYLLTGMDLLLPNAQDYKPTSRYPLQQRLIHLHQLRKETFEKLVRRILQRDDQSKNKSPQSPTFEEGDLVIHWRLTSEISAFAGRDWVHQPSKWSGPCRILGKVEGRKDAYRIQNLWNSDISNRRASELLLLPKDWLPEHFATSLREQALEDSSDNKRISLSRYKPLEDEPSTNGSRKRKAVSLIESDT